MIEYEQHLKLVEESGLFDEEWYLSEYADVQMTGLHPIKHYLKYGAALGRNPNNKFDLRRYVEKTNELLGNVNPFVHFLLTQKGKNELSLMRLKHNETASLNGSSPNLSARLEYVDILGFSGWFVPPKGSMLSAWSIRLDIDGRYETTAMIDRERPDVTKAYSRRGAGFFIAIPEAYLDGKKHTAKLLAEGPSQRCVIACREFLLTSSWRTIGHAYAESNTPPLVLFCSHNLKIQGAQSSLLELVIGLQSKRTVRAVVYSPSDGPMRTSYEKAGIHVIVQPAPKDSNTSESIWESDMANLASCIQSLSPKLVVANTLQSYMPAIAAIRLKIPCLFIPRESEPPESYFDYLPIFIRKHANEVIEKADAVVFVAEATRDLWGSKNSRAHFKVINNGLRYESLETPLAGCTREEARIEVGLKENEVAILSIGTVSPRKGQLDLIEALPGLASQVDVPFRVTLVGMNQNEYASLVESQVKLLPDFIRKRVALLPETESNGSPLVPLLYTASDIFVLNSRYESYPRVVLEALYFGLPIVTTPCFGVNEQLNDSGAAVFYKPGDCKTLADSISHLVNNKGIRQKMAIAARQRLQQLPTYEQMLNMYADTVRSLSKI